MSRKFFLEDNALLTLLNEDSDYAFQALFDRYRDHVYKVAMLYVKSPSLGEDIVQDVFMKVWFQRKNLRSIASFEAWLYTLTRNFSLNCLKKMAREWKARHSFGEEHPPYEDTADHKVRDVEYRELLFKAIEQLPERQQKVYSLAREKGLSYQAIAGDLSLSPLTVKTHMARALLSIRSFMRKHDKELLILFIMASSPGRENIF
ncbi:RNA polymerase sigma factor [Chitinophaga cymbidii]|uniref:RNA polymerase sigma factor n=1 Tax=Chitinophaga cymbidii TaxID=1096750 RepID=UPI0011BFCFCE|nr:RNA polymerase sigma-70 factor [Chitinophaga cymbidii]